MPGTLTPEDLNSAVEAGVIDAAQAEKLKAMRAANNAATTGDAEGVLADEERFRFLNGFNDVFLTIGVLLVAGAFLAATSTSLFGISWVSILALAAATFWILSEILVARLRAVLPGMVLSILFVTFAAAALVVQLHWDSLKASTWDADSELAFWRNPTLTFGAPALVASLVYYFRFRLPFALALVAFFGYVVVSKGLVALTGVTTPFIGFAYGILVLLVALAYDTRDPQRTTRLSDCAFWLHLVAAPLIVSLAISLIDATTHGSESTSTVVLLTVLVLGIFALVIDRRALLVSSLLYFTLAVYDLLGANHSALPGAGMPSSFVLTLALVGAFVLVLGIFWHPLRNRILPIFKNSAIAPYLPPARP
jgi:hypothetical protein